MSIQFLRAQQYAKRDIYRMLGLPEDKRGGNWDTGYTQYGGDFFIFCNVGAPGRTGHDYPNAWDGENLIWYAKNRSRLSHPSIQRLTDESRAIYLFWRSDNEGPFTFAGYAHPILVENTSPVRVTWRFTTV